MRLLPLAIAASLCLAGAARTAANPVPPDDLSLLNGADYFERYCTECHGWDPSLQYDSLYSDDPVSGPDPLLELEQQDYSGDELDELLPPEEDDWPKWAGPPPEVEDEEEVARRAGILTDLVDAIDDVYTEETGDYDWDYGSDYGEGRVSVTEEDVADLDAVFGEELDSQSLRAPGATNLTDPESFEYGTTESELFYSIAQGTGLDMPGFLDLLGSEEAVWDLVNYIRSLWDEDWVD